MPFYYDVTSTQGASTVALATDFGFGRVFPTAGMEAMGIAELYVASNGSNASSTGGWPPAVFKVKSDSTAAQVNTSVAAVTPQGRHADRNPSCLSTWSFSTNATLALSTFSTGAAANTRLILAVPQTGPAATWIALENDAKLALRGSTTVSPFSFLFSLTEPSTATNFTFAAGFSEGAG